MSKKDEITITITTKFKIAQKILRAVIEIADGEQAKKAKGGE